MSAPRFHELTIKRVSPEAAGSVAITFDIPAAERDTFAFQPGQFLTLRARVDGQDVRRNYSISSPKSRLAKAGELGFCGLYAPESIGGLALQAGEQHGCHQHQS